MPKKKPLQLTESLARFILDNAAHELAIEIRDASELEGSIEVMEAMASAFASLARDAADASVQVQGRLKRARRDAAIRALEERARKAGALTSSETDS